MFNPTKSLKRVVSSILATAMCVGSIPVSNIAYAQGDNDITENATFIVNTVDNINRAPLENVVVQVECTSAGRYKNYGEYSSDSAGSIEIPNVPVGYYRITALRAPDGYRVESTPELVYLQNDQGDAPLTTITAYAEKPLTIRKIDAETGNGLQGAVFTVTNSQGHKAGEVTTDAEGYGTIPYLSPGEYTVTETQTPEGQNKAEPQKITVSDTATGELFLAFYANIKNAIAIRVTDKATGEPLEGATFELKLGNATQDTVTTDDHGFAYFKNVTAGKYTVTETVFPEGYLQETTSREVNVDQSGDIISLSITNSRPGGLTVYSKDNNGQPLAGTVFQVYDADGHLVKTGVESNEGGFVTFDGLNPGTYTVMATASDGYILITTSKSVTIKKNEVTIVDFISQSQPSLLITCKDEDGMAVSGVTFSLQKANGGVLGSYQTGVDGTVLVENLDAGTYTTTMTAVPDGYVISQAVQIRTLKAGQQGSVEFVVRSSPYLEIVHQVKGTTEPLADATFELWKGGQKINTYKSGSDGRVLIENLDPGEYTVRHTTTPEGYTIDTQSQNITINGGDSGYLLFTSSRKSSIMIQKVDKTTNEPLAGAQFQIRTTGGQVLDNVITTVDGTATTIALDAGQYIVSEIHAPDGYVVDEASRIVTVQNNEISLQRFTNEKKSSIVITARDLYGNPVAGAVFEVLNAKTGVVIETLTTDTNGSVSTRVLEPGQYTIRQIAAPAGYIKETSTMYNVAVTGEGATNVIFEHSLQTVIQIINEDKDGNPISGGKFKVVNQDTGYVVGYFTTDESGIVTTPILPKGVYIVSQVSTADGYATKNETYTIEVGANDAAIVRFVNAKLSVINIKKTDRDTGAPLAGAVFTISDSSGHVVGRYTTDSTGCLTTQPLPADTYLIREYYAPEGYLIDDSCRTNVVLKEDENTTVEMTNRKAPVIQIIKEDSETGALLAGAEFTIYNDRGEEVGTYETNVDGVATSKELDAGTYTVSETKAPEGYALNSTPQTVKVIAGQTSRITVENKRLAGLVITKTDENGNPLMGAEFTIYNINGSKIATLSTDIDGIASYDNLSTATYIVRETKAPTGYKLNSSPYVVQIKANTSADLKVVNQSLASIIIKKVDADTQEPLADAYFTITDTKGAEVASLVTDNSGFASSEQLEDGTYYVRETKAPTGYAIDQAIKTVQVSAGKSVNLTITNSVKSSIHIHLNDEVTNDGLTGGSFVVRTEDGVVVGQGKTENGLLIIPGLADGNYIVSQVAAPEGYIKDSYTQSITVKSDETTHAYFLNRTSTGIIIENVTTVTHDPLAGGKFEIYDKNGRIIFEGTTADDGILMTGSIPVGKYTIKHVATAEGYTIVTSTQTVTVSNTTPITAVFENQQKSSLIIELIDKNTGAYLEGARFKVQSVNGEFETEVVTDAGGVVTIPNLENGYYIVTQVSVSSEDYILGGTYQFAYIQSGNNTKLTFTNEIYTGLVIENVIAGTHEPLAGGKFEVWTLNETEKIFEGTTDTTGILQTNNITPGKYLIKHLATAEGYKIVTATQIVEVNKNDASYAVFENTPSGTLEITKVDSITRDPLADAEFEIWNQGETKLIGTYTTDRSGRIEVGTLIPGVYVIKETKAPTGYMIDTATKQVTIKSDEATKITFENTRKASLMIEKVDATDNTKMLSGATFTIYDIYGTYIGEYTTEVSGVVFVDNLKDGQYRIVETRAPQGYQIDTAPRTVTVREAMQTKVTFTNKPLTGIVITKVDGETNAKLAGAEFQISKLNGSISNTYVTDSTGMIHTETLEPGQYVIKEMKAPEGYMIDNASQIVTVVAGKPTNIQISNSRMAGIDLYKVDATTQKPLQGATFDLCDSLGNKLDTLITDSTGHAYSDALEAGQYIIKETKAPEGYVIDETAKTVTVSANQQSKITVTNSKMTAIQIWKMDEVTGDMLAGATFNVTKADGTHVTTVTTGTDGIAIIPNTEPGTYNITETKAPEGYLLDSTPQSVTVGTNTPAVVKFYNAPLAALRIQKVDSKTGESLSGAVFKITKANGDYVGEFTSELDGIVNIPTLEPGQYVITEISAPEGYIKDSTPRTVTVKTGTPTVITIENDRTAGLQIRKTVTQTGEPLEGVTFKIKTAQGNLIGDYTTDSMGMIYVSLESGEYIVQETFAPKGYVVDNTPRFVTVKNNEPVILEVTNDKESTVKIHKIDSETGKGIYGVTFEIKDSKNNYIGTYTTDDQGYIELTDVLAEGKYVITEKQAAAGYILDTIPRTVTISPSEPTEITWENTREKGQLVIKKYSADDNATLNIPAHSPLQGAEFTIKTLGGQVVDVIATDATGTAYSGSLDLGTYIVQETKAPNGYSLNNTPVQVNVTSKNQKITLDFYNNSMDIAVNIEKHGEKSVKAGNSMKYYFTNIKNNSNVSVDDFFFSDKLPTDAVRAQTLYTGTWSASVYYKIEYKTNMYDYRTLGKNLNSKTQYSFDMSSTALNLESGEYVTDIRFVMGTVPAGFHEMVSPVLYVYVLPNVKNNYQIINRCEVGAQYNDQWITDADEWTTIVTVPQIQLPDELPTTGF